MTIQEKAIAAWHEHLEQVGVDEERLSEEALKRQEETAKVVATKFEAWYGEPADRIEASPYFDTAKIEYGGLRLNGYVDNPKEFYLTLHGICPKCEREEQSDTFTTLWELGRLLEEGFAPAEFHECGAEE